MKKYTKIIFAGIAIFAFTATMAGAASVTVSPASLAKKVGDSFTVSVGVSTGGSKVCVVEGKVNLDKLSCTDITVADGLIAQTTPTCAKPSFSIGIPGCTTASKNLFSVSVKAPTVGTATLGFTGVDVVGEGISLGGSAGTGEYIITGNTETTVTPTATVTPKPATGTTIKPTVTAPTTETEKTVTEPMVTVTTPASDNNLAAAGSATRGVPLPIAIGIGIAALALGYFTARKMK
ncbi:MAG: hypothetical protein NTZ13_02855 [Candidatus Parcubacteria bacterium]|nr:hypothetical protein [Candidatus Parcubacteria bacterium]